MHFYYVKRDLWGIKAGTVERFAPHKAAGLTISGDIEPYDERRHKGAPGAPQAARVETVEKPAK